VHRSRARSRVFGGALLLLLVMSAPSSASAWTSAGGTSGRCPPRDPPTHPSGPSESAEVVRAASQGIEVSMVRYPRPARTAKLWSQWGQGLVLSDGRLLSALGDHAGADGNSYLFVYDPTTERITRIGDVLSHVDHVPGEWGFGKIHGQIVAGRCGVAYFATYWGTRADIKYTSRYQGDLLFRLDPVTLEMQRLGVPVEKRGIPSLSGFSRRGLVYGEATDPDPPEDLGHEQGAFFVYDTKTRRVVFRSDDTDHTLFRNVMVDAKGRAYVAREGGRLLMYEPGADHLVKLDVELPREGGLRASTRPAPDGTVYGVTQPLVEQEDDRYELFAFSPEGEVRDLGPARGYTASLALNGDGSRFYYVPGAHGDSSEQGTPVIAVDTNTGRQEVVVRLNDLAEDHLGLTLAGSYSVAFDTRNERLYVGLNAGEPENPWGEVVLAIVDLAV
jgi:hypothetical protein